MSRPSPFVLTGIFAVVIGVLAGLPYLKGGLYLDSHEADTYHLIDILFRMTDGQTPHLDFTTPLGILAFFPIVEFLNAGMSLGKAFLASQLFVALLLLPMVVYAACTRLPKHQAVAFGCVVFVLVLTMTYLHVASGVTVAMHYNRWAWAVAFVALLLAFCAPLSGVSRPRIDGILIGLLATALLMMKITYFVALLPAATAALLVRKQIITLGTAMATGVVLIAVSTLFLGIDFWNAYFADLLNVSTSQVRPNVGLPLGDLLSGAPFIGFTLTGIAAAMLIRRAGHDAMGLVVFALLFPGFIFITYQNYGNDPTWLLFMAFLVLAYRPQSGDGEFFGVDLRGAMGVLALVAVLINLPSLYTTAKSPIEHLAFNKERFKPYLSDPIHDDFFIREDRATLMTAMFALDDDEDSVWQKYREPAGRGEIPEIGGVRFPMCELAAGSHAHMNEVAARLSADGVPAGAQLFSTGLLSAFWLYGDFAPLEHGAPWYYGELTGLENADYLVIPKCVFVERVRRIVIDELLEAQVPLTLVQDNALYALFKLD